MPLTLRKAKANRPSPPDWNDDDYDVIWDDDVVGRIYRRWGVADNALPWSWSILVVAPGATTNGLAATLDEAKKAFADHWHPE